MKPVETNTQRKNEREGWK